ncbi:YdcF family protein [Patescibacteria group bacterium]|nr:YdcF family protein [Patescibacteria group bacterium]
MKNISSLIIILVVGIVLFFVSMIAIGFYLSPQDILQEADAVVVISGGETYSRTVEGIKLYQNGYSDLLIFSGAAYDPDSISNAEAMRDIAVDEYSIPSKNIIIEEQSESTYENAQKLQPIFENNSVHSIILVTSPYHQHRSKMTFQYVMGDDFTIINHSATDDLWRKIAWWKNDRAVFLTFSELWKIIYIYATGEYQ